MLTKHLNHMQQTMHKNALRERMLDLIDDSFAIGKKVLRRTR
jgi:hypothetical protein